MFAKLRIERPCSIVLWHMYHPRVTTWNATLDGQVDAALQSAEDPCPPINYMQDRSWVLPMVEGGPQHMQRNNWTDKYVDVSGVCISHCAWLSIDCEPWRCGFVTGCHIEARAPRGQEGGGWSSP